MQIQSSTDSNTKTFTITSTFNDDKIHQTAKITSRTKQKIRSLQQSSLTKEIESYGFSTQYIRSVIDSSVKKHPPLSLMMNQIQIPQGITEGLWKESRTESLVTNSEWLQFHLECRGSVFPKDRDQDNGQGPALCVPGGRTQTDTRTERSGKNDSPVCVDYLREGWLWENDLRGNAYGDLIGKSALCESLFYRNVEPFLKSFFIKVK